MPSIPAVPRARTVLLCVLAACALQAAASSGQVMELRPGELLRFDRPAGTVVELVFDIAADQFVHLEVLQGGTDVAATLIDPTGTIAREVDVVHEAGVIEPISWTRSQPGRYALRLRLKKTQAGGFFDVLLDRPRPAAASDEEWLRCERTYVEALRSLSTSAERTVTTRVLRRLLTDWRALGDERWAALTQLLLGATNYEDSERGADDCLEAADYAERSGDLTVEVAYACASSHLISLGHLEEAILIDEQLLARQEQAGDGNAVRMTRLNLGGHLISAGRTSEAARHLTQTLKEAEASGDGTVQAYAHAHLGQLHRDRGEYQQALDQYARGLATHAYPTVRPAHRAALASVQLAIGDLDAALASAQRAMAEARKVPDARGESAVLETLGRVHVERGEVDQAIALLSSNVALCRRKNILLSEVDGLVALGRAEAARGHRSVARRHQEDALSRSRAHRYRAGEALALSALCALDDAEGISGRSCGDALSTAQAIGYGPVALLSRFYLARAARREGELEVARAQLEETLKVVEGQRLDLRRSDLRQTFSATLDDIEDEYVDVLADLASADPAGGWDVRAFEASERSRGRSLRDELAESRLGIRQGVDPALLQEEDALRDRLRAALARQLRGGGSPAAARDLERTIEGLQASLADVAARIRQASPRYAALSQPEQPSLEAIRAALLDDHTVLLYYALGERRSYLWVVTLTTLERHLLPARRAIERLARPAVAALSAARTTGAALAPLGRVLLAPAAARLDVPRVVVVPDGVLHYVPFAVLPSPLLPEPLLKRSEVVHLPSASAGVLLARAPARPETGDVAVFADPVFRTDDERVRGRSAASPPATMASLPRELTRGRAGLARLPFTRLEARGIETLAGSGGRISLDFDASRATALEERMASYRIVHFATHGLLNASRPELSGIVLSLVDRDGRPQDGFLTSLDTFNLRLDADLVVLSGCRTALGKDVRSEGLVGLTRGLMYAGARGVLASLWPVDDAATAELMRAFYAGLLGPRKLLPPAALREAQLHVRADPRWRAPYYWAAFQLQGVWAGDGTRRAALPNPRN
jgi:CHAT domain-containing protein/predicted negative regulator of RcsB-dependent stress response